MQLRFTSFAVVSLRKDFHLQDRAHAGRTTKKRPGKFRAAFFGFASALLAQAELGDQGTITLDILALQIVQ